MRGFVFYLFLFCCNIAIAQVHYVTSISDSGVGSLREAISNAQNGEIVQLHSDLLASGSQTILLDSSITINKSISVKGLYNSEDTISISGQNSTRIFVIKDCENVHLDSLVLTDGYTEENGGGIYSENIEVLKFTNGILRECKAKLGGGLFCIDSKPFEKQMDLSQVRLLIHNSLIELNEAEHYGGGVYVSVAKQNYKSMLINGVRIEPRYFRTEISYSTFVSNSTIGGGGALCSSIITHTSGHWESPTYGYRQLLYLTVIGSTFYNNSSEKGGSTVSISNGYLYITGSKHDRPPIMGRLTRTEIINSTIYSEIVDAENLIEQCTYLRKVGGLFSDNVPVILKGSILYNLNHKTVENMTDNPINSLGYNIFSDLTLADTLPTDKIQISKDILNLEPLNRNENLITPTLLPAPPSVAINNGDPNDFLDAQTGDIYGIRDIGSAETCKSFSVDNITEFDEYDWVNGEHYTETNTHASHIIENANGCDSVVFLNLEIIESTHPTLNNNPVSKGTPITVLMGNQLKDDRTLDLINSYGSLVQSYVYNPNTGNNTLEIPTKTLSRGVYFLVNRTENYKLKIVVN